MMVENEIKLRKKGKKIRKRLKNLYKCIKTEMREQIIQAHELKIFPLDKSRS